MAKFSSEEAIATEIDRLSGNLPDYTIHGEDLGVNDPAGLLRLFLTSIFGKIGLIVSELKVENLRLQQPYPTKPAQDSDTINLFGVTTKSSLNFKHCDIGTLQLSDAVLRSVYVVNSNIGRVEAARLRLSGSFDFSKARGKVNYLEMSGAEIGGNLDLSSLEIIGSPMPDIPQDQGKKLAVRADGVSIRGNLFMREVIAHGEVRLNGCNVGRNIDIFRGHLSHSGGFALSIAGGDIKGNLGFNLGPERQATKPEATVEGTLRLSATKIRGRLDFSGLNLIKEPTGRYAAECQGIEAGSLSTVSLKSNGAINLSEAIVHGGWTGDNIKLNTLNNPGIVANGIKLNGLLDIVNLETTGFVSFRRGEFRGGFRLNDSRFEPDKLDTAARVQARGAALEYDAFQHSIENWRYVECGLILDRALVFGSFELGACVRRDERSPCIAPRSNRINKAQEKERDQIIEEQKANWNGAYAWLCFDAATIPEIDRTAYLSFREFEFTDLSNCLYKSVITREEAVRADRETHDRIRAKRGNFRQNPAIWQYKKRRFVDFWNARVDVVDAANPQLDAPDVGGWLRILDATYAPLAYRSGHRLPRWAQCYSTLELLTAVSMNGLLFMVWQAPLISSVVAFFILFAILDPIDREFPCLFLQWLADGVLAVAVVGWVCLRVKKSKHISAFARAENNDPRGRGSPIRDEHRPSSERLRNYLLRYEYALKLPVFHPQPYLQLARTMRDDGFDKHASEVVVAMEWRRTWYGDFGPGQQLLQWVKGTFLGFGFNRLRPLVWQLGLVIFSMFIFQYGYETGAIVPSKLNEISPPISSSNPSPKTGSEAAAPVYADKLAYVRFNGFLFAAETVLPLTDFGQKKNWIVEPVAGFEHRRGDFPFPLLNNHDDFWEALSFHAIAVYSVFVTGLGYLMSVLFLAGLSGFITPKF